MDLRPGNRDNIVHDFSLLEIGLGTVELQVLSITNEAATVFDCLFQAHTSPSCNSNRAFCPRSIDHLVTFAGIFADLLNASGAAALNRDELRYAGKEILVLQIGERKGP